jgi:hypothetical protein
LIKFTEENVLRCICFILIEPKTTQKTQNRYSRVWGGAGERGKGRQDNGLRECRQRATAYHSRCDVMRAILEYRASGPGQSGAVLCYALSDRDNQ